MSGDITLSFNTAPIAAGFKRMEDAMADIVAQLNRELYGPPEVIRTVTEDENDFT